MPLTINGPRVLISISAVNLPYKENDIDWDFVVLYGVANDGTLWRKAQDREWEEIVTIPEE